MADEPYLIFLSHKAEVKAQVQKLKEGLEEYGVEAFVAHSDIYPGTEWEDEILEALEDMDAFVPILTKDFRDSEWTDQEVGFAIARGVPIISLMIDMNPYGFMGRFQGITCNWMQAPMEIIKALIVYRNMANTFIKAVAQCQNLSHANRLARILPSIEVLTNEQIHGLLTAFKENEYISKSFGFNGTCPAQYGEGLPALLSEQTGQSFELQKDWQDRLYIGAPSLWKFGIFP